MAYDPRPAFFIKINELDDGSFTYDVWTRNNYHEEMLFYEAPNIRAAEECADALNLASGNWR